MKKAHCQPGKDSNGTAGRGGVEDHEMTIGSQFQIVRFGGTPDAFDTLCLNTVDNFYDFANHPHADTSISHLTTADSLQFRLESVPGKGMAMIATRHLSVGTRIVRERPLMITPHPLSPHAKEQLPSYITFMMPDKKLAFDQLFNCKRAAGRDSNDVLEKLRTNAFGIDLSVGNPRHQAIFGLISRVNHSCTPNAALFYDHDLLCGELICLTPINTGEEICVSYINQYAPAAIRILNLQNQYSFTCTCTACTPSSPTFAFSERRRKAILSSMPSPFRANYDDKYVNVVLGLCEAEGLMMMRHSALCNYAVAEAELGHRERAVSLAQRAMKDVAAAGLANRVMLWTTISQLAKGEIKQALQGLRQLRSGM